ncbi:MAG: T9SS type A sorting domain-containing protein [Bacteroidales bacterium]|jgi:hypothetical protein|nr:T9SS type A sorting domain-containing protein [Bacteroidales bacterium]
MKKIYTTMIAILIVSIGFAQNNVSSVLTTKESGKIPFNMSNLNKDSKIPFPGDFYFDYPTGLEDLCGDAGNYYVVLLPDSLLSTVVTYRAQNYVVGQIFDFSETAFWRDNFIGVLGEDGVWIEYPNVTTATHFDISAIEFPFAYLRGSSEPANVVDTLVVSIAATTDLGAYTSIVSAGAPYFQNPNIPLKQSIANIDPINNFPKFKQIKRALTAADCEDLTSLNGNFKYYQFELDDPDFQNLTPDYKIVIAFSFIHGQPFNVLTSVAGTTHGCGGYLMKEDCRLPTYYQGICESVPNTTEMLNEKSLPLTAMDYSYGLALFLNKFINAEIWCGEIARPRVGMYISNVDVIEAVKTNNNGSFSIQPNPATDNCVVKLAQTGNAQVEVYNLVGQQIFTANTNNQTITINTGSLNSGIYMVKITQNGKVSTSKLMVK